MKKALTPADLRTVSKWGWPVRTYPTHRIKPSPLSPAARA